MIAKRTDDAFSTESLKAPLPPRPVLEVTTRHARCVLGMPGLRIIEARRKPVEYRGLMVRVTD